MKAKKNTKTDESRETPTFETPTKSKIINTDYTQNSQSTLSLKKPIRMTIKLEDIINISKTSQKDNTLNVKKEDIADIRKYSSRAKLPIHNFYKDIGNNEKIGKKTSKPNTERPKSTNRVTKSIDFELANMKKTKNSIASIEKSIEKKFGYRVKVTEIKNNLQMPESVLVIVDNVIQAYTIKKL